MATPSSSAGRPSEPFWLDPSRIRFKIAPIGDLRGRRGGDWDLERRHALTETVKYRAVIAHFRDGVAWADTDLFGDLYRRRFESGGHVRGAATLPDLLDQYNTRVDGLAESMRRDGFLTHDAHGRELPLPGLYIGRGGEVFIGNQGNHRLAIAHAIELQRFAGRIVCRHKQS